MSEPPALLDIRVREADTLLHLVPATVGLDAPLPVIVRTVAGDPVARCAFVVDADGCLKGVVSVDDLDREMLMLVRPGVAANAGEHIGARQLARLAHGVDETARHLMRDAAAVRLDDTLGVALRRMSEHRLESAAVLDAEGTPLGYVAMFEILAELVVPRAMGR